MLRIAIISNYFAPHIGGVETQNQLIGEALVRRGHDVTVVTRRYHPALPGREVLNGLKVERLRPGGMGMLSKWLMNASILCRMISARPSFDVMLVNQFSAHVFGPALASVLRHVPFVLRAVEAGEFSGDISTEALNRIPFPISHVIASALRAARSWAYHRARLVIAISTAMGREATSYGIPSESVALISNAVDTDRFAPIPQDQRDACRKSLSLAHDSQVVTYVGRLVRGKGLLTLIEAWAGIARNHPQALLLIVGSGPGNRSPHDAELSLRDAIAAAGLQQRVRLTGAVENVEQYLQASDLFVFPSEQEGFGNALAEAMSCGLPIVCTRIEGAAADLIVDGEHGFKVDVGESRALQARLSELLTNEPMRKQMGDASRAMVEERLSIDRVAAAYEQAFLAVSRERRQTVTCVQIG